MIKNLLYSIFFHFLLIALIYANFNLKTSDEVQSNQVSISLISKEDFESRFKTPQKKKEETSPKKESAKKELKKEQPEPQKKSEEESQPQVESEEKPQPIVETETPVEEKPKEKKPEIKKEEKEIEKKEEPKDKEPENKKEIKKPEEKIVEEKVAEKENKKVEKQEEEKKLEDSKHNESDKRVNDLENLNLSTREKFNIRSQLSACYIKALGENNMKEDKLTIIVEIKITKEGFITSNLESQIDDKEYSQNQDYKNIVNNVRRALTICSPLRNLPTDKYNIWKQVSLEFGKIEEKLTQPLKTQ